MPSEPTPVSCAGAGTDRRRCRRRRRPPAAARRDRRPCRRRARRATPPSPPDDHEPAERARAQVDGRPALVAAGAAEAARACPARATEVEHAATTTNSAKPSRRLPRCRRSRTPRTRSRPAPGCTPAPTTPAVEIGVRRYALCRAGSVSRCFARRLDLGAVRHRDRPVRGQLAGPREQRRPLRLGQPRDEADRADPRRQPVLVQHLLAREDVLLERPEQGRALEAARHASPLWVGVPMRCGSISASMARLTGSSSTRRFHRSARRPPGRSTRWISASAAGPSNQWNAWATVTRSTDAVLQRDRLGRAVERPHRPRQRRAHLLHRLDRDHARPARGERARELAGPRGEVQHRHRARQPQRLQRRGRVAGPPELVRLGRAGEPDRGRLVHPAHRVEVLGQQRVHDEVLADAVAAAVPAQHALAGEAGPLGQPLGRLVLRVREQLEALEAQRRDGPLGQHPGGARADAAPARLRSHPVADLALHVGPVEVRHPEGAQHAVVGVHDGQRQLAPGGEVGGRTGDEVARVPLGVVVRHHGPARDLGVLAGGRDRRHVPPLPRPQEDLSVSQRRVGKRDRAHRPQPYAQAARRARPAGAASSGTASHARLEGLGGRRGVRRRRRHAALAALHARERHVRPERPLLRLVQPPASRRVRQRRLPAPRRAAVSSRSSANRRAAAWRDRLHRRRRQPRRRGRPAARRSRLRDPVDGRSAW